VTTKNLLFSGWPECRVTINLRDVASVDKTNSLMIIPNALLIKTVAGEEYFFGSFMEREQCYALLNSMVEVAKGLQEIKHPEGREGKSGAGTGAGTGVGAGTGAGAGAGTGAGAGAEGSMEEKMKKNDLQMSNTLSDIKALSSELKSGNRSPERSIEAISSDDDGDTATGFDKALLSDGIVHMHADTLPVKSKLVWKHFWQSGSGYRYATAIATTDTTSTTAVTTSTTNIIITTNIIVVLLLLLLLLLLLVLLLLLLLRFTHPSVCLATGLSSIS
jgi:hypothetical protein